MMKTDKKECRNWTFEQIINSPHKISLVTSTRPDRQIYFIKSFDDAIKSL